MPRVHFGITDIEISAVAELVHAAELRVEWYRRRGYRVPEEVLLALSIAYRIKSAVDEALP